MLPRGDDWSVLIVQLHSGPDVARISELSKRAPCSESGCAGDRGRRDQRHRTGIRRWQARLNGLSKLVACGCVLTRDIEQYIRASSFVIDDLQQVPAFSGHNALYTHIRGIAAKPAWPLPSRT